MILGLWLILYASFTLFMPPLLDDADSVHAEAAREMLLRHDYVTLTTNGVRYLEKAPLLYWLMAGFLRLMGGPRHPHVWAARLPLALTMLALAYVLRRLGREMFGSDRAGFYAAVIALTSFGVFIFTRILIPDALLTLWIAAGLLFFWRTLRSEAEGDAPKMLDCMGIGACCALAVLSKGLIGILFPVAVIFLFLGCTKNLWHLARFNPVTSLVTFLLIAAPWHWMAALRSPAQGNPLGFTPTPGNVHGFAWFYFVNDQFARYVGRRVPHDYDTVPLVLFWGLVLVWLMPWSAFLFKALRRVPLWAGVRRLDLSEAEQPWFFCGLWALVVMVFFSFSTRQEYYVLPAVPALALLLGAWLAAEHHASIGDDATPLPDASRALRVAAGGRPASSLLRAGRRISAVLLVAGALLAIAALFCAMHYPPPGADGLAAMLARSPQEYALSFGHFLDLRLAVMGAFRWPLTAVALALLTGACGNYFFRLRGRPGTANMFLTGMAVAILVASHFALVTFSPILSSATLAQAISPEVEPDSLVVVNGEYEDASTLAWYLQKQLHILHAPSSDLWYGSFFPDAPKIWETPQSLAAEWNSAQRVFLWTRDGEVPALPGQSYVLARSGGKEILSNQPNQGGASF